MKPATEMTHRFVEFVPDDLDERTLYVSTRYKTVVHLCCCGCGRLVVTPLSPAAWRLTFDGASISLHPSVGSWNLPCKSHYWIDRNRVEWSGTWSPAQIKAGRARESQTMAEYYGAGSDDSQTKDPAGAIRSTSDDIAAATTLGRSEGFWGRLKKRLLGR